MTGYRFDFANTQLVARPSGALYWPSQQALLVADLHLGKSARLARRGGALLPPFETHDTIERLADEVAALAPKQLFLLGDSFDDDMAAAEIADGEAARLRGLATRCRLTMIRGNHDPSATGGADELKLDGITLRHRLGEGPDISGHYHPAKRIAGQWRRVFLIDAQHVILPAFGSYTGGLDVDGAPLDRLVGPGIAVVTGPRAVPIPLRPPKSGGR